MKYAISLHQYQMNLYKQYAYTPWQYAIQISYNNSIKLGRFSPRRTIIYKTDRRWPGWESVANNAGCDKMKITLMFLFMCTSSKLRSIIYIQQ